MATGRKKASRSIFDGGKDRRDLTGMSGGARNGLARDRELRLNRPVPRDRPLLFYAALGDLMTDRAKALIIRGNSPKEIPR